MMRAHNPSREDIVITGISCRFAEVDGSEAFWRQILTKKSAFTPVSFEEKSSVGITSKPLFDMVIPKYAAVLGNLYSCNPEDQYFPRKINAGENPDLFFAVQLVIDAIKDSGTTVNCMPTDRVSLRMGYAPPFNVATVNWLQHTYFLHTTMEIVQKFFPGATLDQLEEVRSQLISSLPEANPYAFASAISSATTAWTAHLLGFAGPAFVLDEGAISGVQALQGAMDDLLAKRSDIALAGAIQPPLSPTFIQGLSGFYQFSRGKSLQPFSRKADGILPGEGGVFFVLKRLKDALRQGDRIYAIVRGTGIAAASMDQQRRVPIPEQLTRALSRAFHAADVAPESIQLIEAHGSCIPHSDETEIECIQGLYGERKPHQPLVGIGSVKGNIGHTLWASGAAGIAKAALSIYHRVMPPQIPVDKTYQSLCAPQSPISLLTEIRPWLRGNKKNPRRACVSSIDFSGTCGAVVLEEYPKAEA